MVGSQYTVRCHDTQSIKLTHVATYSSTKTYLSVCLRTGKAFIKLTPYSGLALRGNRLVDILLDTTSTVEYMLWLYIY